MTNRDIAEQLCKIHDDIMSVAPFAYEEAFELIILANMLVPLENQRKYHEELKRILG